MGMRGLFACAAVAAAISLGGCVYDPYPGYYGGGYYGGGFYPSVGVGYTSGNWSIGAGTGYYGPGVGVGYYGGGRGWGGGGWRWR